MNGLMRMRKGAVNSLLFTGAAALPVTLAAAQTQAVAPPVPVTVVRPPVASPAVAAQPQAVPPAQVAPEPAPMPPLLWTVPAALELKAFIEGIGAEGLDPLDYDPIGLSAALASGDPARMSAAATERFNKVSSDLAFGHVRGEARGQWLIKDAQDLDANRQYVLLQTAIGQNRVGDALRSLLPTHPQYRDLKTALAKTDPADATQVNRLKLNLDRWRWLPRDLGEKYIIVNVPAFYVALVENGQTRWRQRAVAGSPRTPTPAISATASGVIFNPWWEVPKSIEGEVRGKAGYVAVKGKDGKVQRWRQPPGPSNALGELKFVMPNSEAIFLHDTNARSRFNSNNRSLSHGCIRTQNIHDLSAVLLSDDGGEWTKDKVKETIASKKTVEAQFVKPLPVYIVYFSAAASTDGKIITYNDVYKRDGKVIAALNDRALGRAGATKTASR